MMPMALIQAIKDVCWKAQPYGEDEDGFTTHYLISVGPIHRLVAAAQGYVPGVALRNPNYNEDGSPAPPPHPGAGPMNARIVLHRLIAMSAAW